MRFARSIIEDCFQEPLNRLNSFHWWKDGLIPGRKSSKLFVACYLLLRERVV